MTTLVLVRHGTTAGTGSRLGGHTDARLDTAGQAQAEAAADRLADVPLKAIYSSPLRRATETAAAIGRRCGLAVRTLGGLVEVDYGTWTDRPLKPLARTRLWPIIQQQPTRVGFPQGETIRAAQLRAVDAVEEVVATHRRDVIALVSHGDIIKALVAFYLGMGLDLFQRLHVGPASLSVLQLDPDGGRPLLLRLGDDGPLTAERFRPPHPPTKRQGPARGGRGRVAQARKRQEPRDG